MMGLVDAWDRGATIMLSEDFLEDLTTRTDEEVRKKLGYCTNLHIWRAVERAAREAVLKEITEAFHASVVAALREES
jgi:hypothetical protein